jgi:predicted phage terminase large subunit-like protein
LERRAFSVQAMRPIKDKHARLRVAVRYIKNGTVRFPRTGCEQLLAQFLGFDDEKHDDAVDALVYLILGLVGVRDRGAASSLRLISAAFS